MNKHNWKNAPVGSGAHWICTECGLLEFNPIAEDTQTCRGSIRKAIEEEMQIKRKTWQQLTEKQQAQARAMFLTTSPESYTYEIGIDGKVLSRKHF